MEELRKHGELGKAALRAGMSRNTGAKYATLGKLPSELQEPRTWRTRADPFEEDWQAVVALITELPELEAKTIFDDLLEGHPDRYEPGQLRTLQRHLRQWRAEHGPPKEIFFAQQHRPGEAMQTDFTCANELEISIAGEPFPHLLCHPVLPFSNWEWATVCRSESIPALKRGVQSALFRLGRTPSFHQTDNSTAATHDLKNGKRGFNREYLALMEHFSMRPRTIQVGEKHQNGDAEASHRALKGRLKQRLLLRRSQDFESVASYERWLREVIDKANCLRRTRLEEELAAMKPISVKRLPEYTLVRTAVSSWSTVRVRANIYSVPSRLIGETVRIRIYDDRLEVYFAGKRQLSMERLLGKNGHQINYRHIIWSLVKKPGAFARYRYREGLFPSLIFRRAYDALAEGRSERKADLEYLRLLHLAASTSETEVEAAVQLLLDEGEGPSSERVKQLVAPAEPEIPQLEVPSVDLHGYDALLEEVAS